MDLRRSGGIRFQLICSCDCWCRWLASGALTIGVGAVLAYSSRRRRGPSKEHLQLRTETAEGGLGVSGKLE
eukprot:scaffold2276_cov210-Pinguiococcus_pyrenoidosus.AAC.3